MYKRYNKYTVLTFRDIPLSELFSFLPVENLHTHAFNIASGDRTRDTKCVSLN